MESRERELRDGAEPTEQEEFLAEMGGTAMLAEPTIRDFAAYESRNVIEGRTGYCGRESNHHDYCSGTVCLNREVTEFAPCSCPCHTVA